MKKREKKGSTFSVRLQEVTNSKIPLREQLQTALGSEQSLGLFFFLFLFFLLPLSVVVY